MLALLSNWLTTLSLIFGGCCSNAITLEQLTLSYPRIGSILTLLQFLVISLYTLPKFLIFKRLLPGIYVPWLRKRRVPISSYLLQVILFYLVSLLNNKAFAYQIPMAVHIIFRSGGLMISLVLGWLVSKKRYNSTQVISVLLVTGGVITTTLSAQSSSSSKSTSGLASPPIDLYTYAQGIGILTSALILSGFLGLIQDWTYAKYGRPSLPSSSNSKSVVNVANEIPPPWQESMFYLHFLALPMFIPLFPDLVTQMNILNSSAARSEFSLPPIPIPEILTTKNLDLDWNLTEKYPLNLLPPYALPTLQLPLHIFPHNHNSSLITITQPIPLHSTEILPTSLLINFSIPHIYFPLLVNTLTQLFCVAGVHRLTTRVSALTVTLVLVVRKAASLVISVIGVESVWNSAKNLAVLEWASLENRLGVNFTSHLESLSSALPDLRGYIKPEWIVMFKSYTNILTNAFLTGVIGLDTSDASGTIKTKSRLAVDRSMMWTGAALVLVGTIGYTIGTGWSKGKEKEKKE